MYGLRRTPRLRRQKSHRVATKKISHKKAQKAQRLFIERVTLIQSICAFCAFLWLIFFVRLVVVRGVDVDGALGEVDCGD